MRFFEFTCWVEMVAYPDTGMEIACETFTVHARNNDEALKLANKGAKRRRPDFDVTYAEVEFIGGIE